MTTADTLRFSAPDHSPDYAAYQPAAGAQSDYRSYAPIVETSANDGKRKNLRESQIMDSSSNEFRNESSPDSGEASSSR